MASRLMFAYDIVLSSTATTPGHVVPFGVRMVRLYSTGNCYVVISGAGTAAAIGAGTLLFAGQNDLFADVDPGDRISVIAASGSTGVLNVTELSE